jgi:hypothetical protein
MWLEEPTPKLIQTRANKKKIQGFQSSLWHNKKAMLKTTTSFFSRHKDVVIAILLLLAVLVVQRYLSLYLFKTFNVMSRLPEVNFNSDEAFMQSAAARKTALNQIQMMWMAVVGSVVIENESLYSMTVQHYNQKLLRLVINFPWYWFVLSALLVLGGMVWRMQKKFLDGNQIF